MALKKIETWISLSKPLKDNESQWHITAIRIRKLCNFRHTVSVSAMPDSNNSSRAAAFKLPDTILLTSVFRLFRSDLYSLNLARSTALTLGCKLLASRSIFRIWNIYEKHLYYYCRYKTLKITLGRKSKVGTKDSASSIPAFISETFCFFCSTDQ